MRLTVFLRRGLRYYFRRHLLLALAAATATAAVAGSLTVGESVSASLRELALRRLCGFKQTLVTSALFRESLAEELTAAYPGATVFPLLHLRGFCRRPGEDLSLPEVEIYGVDAAFAARFFPSATGLRGRAVCGATLRKALGVSPGEPLILGFSASAQAARDARFSGAGRSATATARLAAAESAGACDAFSLRADAYAPRNVFVDLKFLQEQTSSGSNCNLLLIDGELPPEAAAQAARLEDYGLRVTTLPDGSLAVKDAGGLGLAPETVAALGRASGGSGVTEASFALAKTLGLVRDGERVRVPYSLCCALSGEGGPPRGEIWLNDWAEEELRPRQGDAVELVYLSRTADGTFSERKATLKYSARFGMAEAKRLGAAVPDYPGLAEASRAGEWEAPFPLDLSLIRPRDDEYWEKYRVAPKARVHPADLPELWGEAERSVGALLAPARAAAKLPQAAARELARSGAALRLSDARAEALLAARGSTDFPSLFLYLGGFLIISAGLAIRLLAALAVEERRRQLGLLASVGVPEREALGALFAELFAVCAAGVALGAPLGVAYAGAVVKMLAGGWAGAVAGFPVRLQFSWQTLIGGAGGALLVTAAALAAGLRGTRGLSPLELLRGAEENRQVWRVAGDGRIAAAAGALLALAAGCGGAAAAGLLPQTEGFFLCGLLLLAGLTALFFRGIAPRRSARPAVGAFGLARRRLACNRASAATVFCLAAGAGFTLAAVAAGRADYAASVSEALLVTTSLPVPADLATAAGRERAGFAGDAAELRGTEIFSLRRAAGENAGCLNLNRVREPAAVGLPAELACGAAGIFAGLPADRGRAAQAWERLDRIEPDGAIPVFADADSAEWILKKNVGETLELPVPGRAAPAWLRLAGLLHGGIFAGELLLAERNFRLLFEDAGYNEFLVAPGSAGARQTLLRGLAAYGPDARTAGEILNRYAQVQNAYLAAFQTLGGLGLLLGTAGMALVLLKRAAADVRELALLRAAGWSGAELFRLLCWENGLPLAAGLLAGAAGALAAMLPHFASETGAVNWAALAGVLGAALLCGAVSCAAGARLALRGCAAQALRRE